MAVYSKRDLDDLVRGLDSENQRLHDELEEMRKIAARRLELLRPVAKVGSSLVAAGVSGRTYKDLSELVLHLVNNDPSFGLRVKDYISAMIEIERSELGL